MSFRMLKTILINLPNLCQIFINLNIRSTLAEEKTALSLISSYEPSLWSKRYSKDKSIEVKRTIIISSILKLSLK